MDFKLTTVDDVLSTATSTPGDTLSAHAHLYHTGALIIYLHGEIHDCQIQSSERISVGIRVEVESQCIQPSFFSDLQQFLVNADISSPSTTHVNGERVTWYVLHQGNIN